MKFDWKVALSIVDFHLRMFFSMEKFVFCGWPTVVQSHLFSKLAGANDKSHAGQVKRKFCCGELPVKVTLLGLPHRVKAASEIWPNPRVKVNSTIAGSFQ